MQKWTTYTSVWQNFNCKNLREYNVLYQKNDVLLLADFFEQFRQMCLDNYGIDIAHYGIDIAHYCFAPGMAWDAALK